MFKDLLKSPSRRDVGYMKTMQERHGDFFNVLKAYLRALAAVDGHKPDRKAACSMIADGLVVNYLELAWIMTFLAIKKYENTPEEYVKIINKHRNWWEDKYKVEFLRSGFDIQEVSGDNLTERQIVELKAIYDLPELDMFS